MSHKAIAIDRPESMRGLFFSQEGEVNELFYRPEDVETPKAVLQMVGEYINLCKGHVGVCVDIGASVGSATVLLSLHGAKVVWAFEPHPVLFSYLIKNLGKNPSNTPVHPFQLCVWDQTALMIPFNQYSVPEQSAPIFHTSVLPQTIVMTIGFNDLLRIVGPTIDFLKIDCEGSEHIFWKNVSEEQITKVKYLHFEYHDVRDKQYFIDDIEWMDFPGQILPALGFEPVGCNGFLFGNKKLI